MLLMAGAAVVRGSDEEKGSEFHHSLPFLMKGNLLKWFQKRKNFLLLIFKDGKLTD